MKLEAKFPPPLLSVSKSVAKLIGRHAAYLMTAIILLAYSSPGHAQSVASGTTTPQASNLSGLLDSIKDLSKKDIRCSVYAEAVADMVAKNPDDVEAIISEAVKDKPGCMCEVVESGIKAVTPQNGTPDPNLVASIVAAVVQNIQTTNPELMERVISCALAVAPDAQLTILNSLAGLYNGPNGLLRPATDRGNGSGVAPGVGANMGFFHKQLLTPPFEVTRSTPL